MRDALGGVQSVLVLGGASELGLAVVGALDLRPGAAVVLAGRSPDALRAVGEALARDGRDIDTVVIGWDAAGGAAAAEQVVADAVAAVGDLDVVIAAAGVLGDQAEAERDVVEAVRVLEVNLVGLGAACLAAADRLRTQGHGALVVLSSVAALRARRSSFVYGASKAGLDALASGLVDALRGSGAQALVVRPGFVTGRMTAGLPAAPFATDPATVGRAVADALRAGREVVHVPPVLGPLFAGLRLLPRPIWRRLAARA